MRPDRRRRERPSAPRVHEIKAVTRSPHPRRCGGDVAIIPPWADGARLDRESFAQSARYTVGAALRFEIRITIEQLQDSNHSHAAKTIANHAARK